MIIPFLKHITKIQNQEAKVKYLVNYYSTIFLLFPIKKGIKNRRSVCSEQTVYLPRTDHAFALNKSSVSFVRNILPFFALYI